MGVNDQTPHGNLVSLVCHLRLIPGQYYLSGVTTRPYHFRGQRRLVPVSANTTLDVDVDVALYAAYPHLIVIRQSASAGGSGKFDGRKAASAGARGFRTGRGGPR